MNVLDQSEATFETHTVFNQPPLYDGINLYSSDRALQTAIDAEGASGFHDSLSQLGAELGSHEQFEQARLANTHLPILKTHDEFGNRIDIVEFHPAYHHFFALSKREGIHSGQYEALLGQGPVAPGLGVARAARHYMVIQVEAGHICPITMTHASIPSLQIEKSLADWLPGVLSRSYDPSFRPAHEKTGLTIGMGMTEKQGGTDLRSNTTRAIADGVCESGRRYAITGHKWFMSAPMCDAFLVLAQAERGLSVFLVPRFREDGRVNGLRFQRLKNKLGDKSNASSEVELHAAEGFLIGDEGRGIAQILIMASLTRVDCALGSAGLMRQAFSRAVFHARHRSAFAKRLIDQPMMTAVLADMALEVEAATMLSLRLAAATEKQGENSSEAAYARLMNPVTKYWVTKRGPALAYEAMECLGGNGYVEDGVLPRIYRQLPVNSIWEGTGSVMCLDVLRVLGREPEKGMQLIEDLAKSRGGDRAFDRAYDELRGVLARGAIDEARGRWLTEQLAIVAAAALLMERSPNAIAEAYIATRLKPEGRSGQYGVLPAGIDTRGILEASGSRETQP